MTEQGGGDVEAIMKGDSKAGKVYQCIECGYLAKKVWCRGKIYACPLCGGMMLDEKTLDEEDELDENQ